MSNKPRYVFDTNVIVSALLFAESEPAKAFRQSLADGTILVSEALIQELSDVLSRPKFDRYVRPNEREQFLEALIHEAEVVEIAQSIQVCRDPKDDKVLELAVNGGATFVVSGDAALLVLDPFQGIRIVAPAQLLTMKKLGSSGGG